MPTFEVHGLVGGYTGPGSKTILPHKATAKVDSRLVRNHGTRGWVWCRKVTTENIT